MRGGGGGCDGRLDAAAEAEPPPLVNLASVNTCVLCLAAFAADLPSPTPTILLQEPLSQGQWGSVYDHT